jgi:twitching motility protein PilT
VIALSTIDPILTAALEADASDIHLRTGSQPRFRNHGKLETRTDLPVSDILLSALARMRAEHVTRPGPGWEDDYAFTYADRRFRVNSYKTLSRDSAVVRLVPPKIRTLAELGAPASFAALLDRLEGLVIVAGATGDGKTTTLAAAIAHLNTKHSLKLLTLEDPAEYHFPEGTLVIDQRELNVDFRTYAEALKFGLRQDPDIILIGELRDPDTMRLAIEASETGHLVLSSLHAPTTAKAAARLIDAFSEAERPQQQAALASASAGFVCQRLVPKIGGGRIAAFEFAVTEGAIRSLIRDGKWEHIAGEIRMRGRAGMQTLDMSLARLVSARKITREDAMKFTIYPAEFQQLLSHL